MNLRRHDLNLLVILEAVLREGSISAAAHRLNLTQPAVSQALSRGREMFGDPLMLRSGRGLVPTTRAMALRGELGEILGRIGKVIDGPEFEPQTASQTFRIATSDLGEFILLPEVLSRLINQAPHCRYEVQAAQHDYGSNLPDVLLIGAELPAGNWLSSELFSDHFVLIARKGHIALTQALDVATFARLPQAIVSPRGGGFDGPVDDALAALGQRHHVTLSLPRFGTLPRILAQSDLVVAVPSRFAELPFVQALCGVREMPIAIPPFTMKLAWHTTREHDPAQIWLRALFSPQPRNSKAVRSKMGPTM